MRHHALCCAKNIVHRLACKAIRFGLIVLRCVSDTPKIKWLPCIRTYHQESVPLKTLCKLAISAFTSSTSLGKTKLVIFEAKSSLPLVHSCAMKCFEILCNYLKWNSMNTEMETYGSTPGTGVSHCVSRMLATNQGPTPNDQWWLTSQWDQWSLTKDTKDN